MIILSGVSSLKPHFQGGSIPAEIYKVTLTDEEHEYLTDLISKGKAAGAEADACPDSFESRPEWERTRMGRQIYQ
jgi:hypothetical protein